MDILATLKQEESNLQQQLKAIQTAITALNGDGRPTVSSRHTSGSKRTGGRTISAAGRARISRAAKARWAKIRAEKAKKVK